MKSVILYSNIFNILYTLFVLLDCHDKTPYNYGLQDRWVSSSLLTTIESDWSNRYKDSQYWYQYPNEYRHRIHGELGIDTFYILSMHRYDKRGHTGLGKE